MEEKELSCVYGSEDTPGTVFYYNGWYVIEGSVNVNRTHQDFKFVEGVDVEEIIDCDTCTAQDPINSLEELKSFIEEDD